MEILKEFVHDSFLKMVLISTHSDPVSPGIRGAGAGQPMGCLAALFITVMITGSQHLLSTQRNRVMFILVL